MYIRTDPGLGEPPAPVTLPVIQSPMVRVANALAEPYRYVCRLVARAYDMPTDRFSIGTGFLISPYHVLTCAHNIYPLEMPHTGSIVVYPGQNGPDDSAVRIAANGWAVSPGWRPKDCATSGNDYGIIRLATPSQYGSFQLRSLAPASVAGTTAQLAGYPYDGLKSRLMYRSTGLVIGEGVIRVCEKDGQGKDVPKGPILTSTSSTTSFIVHVLASSRGVSGGPIWFEEGGSRTVIGIHERALNNNQQGGAVFLNDAARAQIERWMSRTLPPLRR